MYATLITHLPSHTHTHTRCGPCKSLSALNSGRVSISGRRSDHRAAHMQGCGCIVCKIKGIKPWELNISRRTRRCFCQTRQTCDDFMWTPATFPSCCTQNTANKQHSRTNHHFHSDRTITVAQKVCILPHINASLLSQHKHWTDVTAVKQLFIFICGEQTNTTITQ